MIKKKVITIIIRNKKLNEGNINVQGEAAPKECNSHGYIIFEWFVYCFKERFCVSTISTSEMF